MNFVTTDAWEMIATERRRLADELERLTPEQWATQSQCEAWDVRSVAAHIVSPFDMGFGAFVGGMFRSRFNIDRMALADTARTADRMSDEQIVAAMRDGADNRWQPPVPGIGVEIPLSEIVVHAQDIRRPLGLDNPIPQETIDACLRLIKNEKTRADFRARIGGLPE